jgi:hypothetical protein
MLQTGNYHALRGHTQRAIKAWTNGAAVARTNRMSYVEACCLRGIADHAQGDEQLQAERASESILRSLNLQRPQSVVSQRAYLRT